MIAITITEVQNVITLMDKEIRVQKKTLQERLKRRRKKLTAALHLQYIDYLMALQGEIITAPPSRLKTISENLEKIVSPADMAKKRNLVLQKSLAGAFGYQELRTNFYPDFFGHLGIKACAYCNAHLTVTVTEKKGHRRAKFQVDHYWAKIDMPAFSASLYNLYPVCASCNNIKGTKKVIYDLYLDKLSSIPLYEFYIEPATIQTYLDQRKLDDIEIKFIEPSVPTGYKTFNDLFAIEGIYDTQKDIAAELILKNEVYTPAYKQGLITQFPTIFNPAIIDRLITGNYTSENEIHKRPMAKFMRDISLQLGLIKK